MGRCVGSASDSGLHAAAAQEGTMTPGHDLWGIANFVALFTGGFLNCLLFVH